MLMERLRPGDRLPPERELAERFRVSRVTVRQALSVLQAMGLIESRVGDGTYARGANHLAVTPLASVLHGAPGTFGEQTELRRLIEPEVARLAAERAGETEINDIAKYVHLQERKLAKGLHFVEEDSAMHLAIASASRNSLLMRMMEGIHGLLDESRVESLQTKEGMMRSLDGHRRIVQAIQVHDGSAAYRAMLDHVRDVESLILKGRADVKRDELRPTHRKRSQRSSSAS